VLRADRRAYSTRSFQEFALALALTLAGLILVPIGTWEILGEFLLILLEPASVSKHFVFLRQRGLPKGNSNGHPWADSVLAWNLPPGRHRAGLFG
jgi:hypothetical protein